jgi:hypothetical protein
MKDVTVLKHGKFNLFSIPKMLTQGWKLGGDGEQIRIFKEDARIDFDIKIPTPKGALYAMHGDWTDCDKYRGEDVDREGTRFTWTL